MRSILLTVLCCAVISVSNAQTKIKKEKKQKAITVFSVNKKPVVADEFIYLYKKNHQNAATDFTTEKIQEYLDLFINFKLKVEEAKHRGLDTAAAFVKEYNSYKDELRKPYLPDSKLTDSLVKLTYNRTKEEIHAAHILINLKPDASPEDTLQAYNKITDIRSKAVAGEDFGTLAATYSEDPSAKSNKGDLGYFTALQMVYPFETGAYITPVGQVSPVIRTKFGYHILKVIDRRPSRGEVEVSHIMIRTGDNKDNQKAKNTIFDIYDQLNKGVKWDELCKQYSEDPGSKENGGKLRPFGVGTMASVPAFETTAFSLQKPGDISDPFETQYGWHIMRLDKKIATPSYDEIAPTLKSKVTRDERVQISQQAVQAKLRRDYLFTEKPTVKTKVFATADTTLTKGKWKTPSYANGDKEILFALQGNSYTVNNFLQYVQKKQHATNQQPAKFIEQLYNNYVDASILALFEEKLTQNNPDYRMLLKEYYEGILLFEIMEKEVWNKATADSAGQRKYYEANTAKYQAKERAQATLYSSASKDVINTLTGLLSMNDSSKLKPYITAQKIKEENGLYEKEEKAVLGKVTWGKGQYPAENNGMYYLVWIQNILPPAPKTFDEARASVISDYQNYLEKKWLDQLKEKYPVKVNAKGKQYVLQHLQQK